MTHTADPLLVVGDDDGDLNHSHLPNGVSRKQTSMDSTSDPDQDHDHENGNSSSDGRGASTHTVPSDAGVDPVDVSRVPDHQTPNPAPVSTDPDVLARRPATPPPPRRLQSEEPSQQQQQQQHRARRRSAIDTRASNRLSGFFTSLMNRTHAAARSNTRDGPSSEPHTRTTSPLPPPRPTTPPPPPPPSLPPPTLQELGLSLSVLTNNLAPSHFTTPPTSGAFLAPHFLLLCHAQGLDVLPLLSPPSLQPYALVRRVSFKSVVVMEQRGVLVAIAGRRDGVRVYALEEIKRVIEWRMEMEIRRERDRSRRETVKKFLMDGTNPDSSEKSSRKPSLSTPPPSDPTSRRNLLRRTSYNLPPTPPLPTHAPSPPLIPRSPTHRALRRRTPQIQVPTDHPPPYTCPSDLPYPPRLNHQPSAISFRTRSRAGSVSEVLAAAPHPPEPSRNHDPDAKADWAESSDDEAINIVAAESSGSQALDERTSATLSASATTPRQTSPPIPLPASVNSIRRNRPSNLDLSLSRSNPIDPPEPSPAPTLLTLRQALSYSPPMTRRTIHTTDPEPDTPFLAAEDDEDDAGDDGVSLAQVLFESRLPSLPPAGTRRPQEPIWLSSSQSMIHEPEPASPRTSEGHTFFQNSLPTNDNSSRRRRRRWSSLLGVGSGHSLDSSDAAALLPPPTTAPETMSTRSARSASFLSTSHHSQISIPRPSTSPTISTTNSSSIQTASTLPDMRGQTPSVMSSQSSRSSRFIPRILANALQGRRSEDRPPLPLDSATGVESPKKIPVPPPTPQAPPPKLEYVKLPGTKGALLIKSVETFKKSFLAILCGENGEKVELFAGTYRTALGLSRTFILPDSPRSLELQLQGDDLVEVFLVFSQNVFGLEPATVRVREVRIGRAERRAARRRVRDRETRIGESVGNDSETLLAEDDTNVNVNIVGSTVVASDNRSGSPSFIPNEHPDAQHDSTPTPTTEAAPTSSAVVPSEELVAIASTTAQMGPYTTFQQLSFAPKFPLASIADDYIIPPTYPSFLEYRAAHEPDGGGSSTADLTQIQFCPPGLPVPVPTAPSRWFYRDPKDRVHGPWKASLMQAWYKDGLLPPDLPVRREEDDTFMLLKDLRQQSIDPTQPFHPPSAAATTTTGLLIPEPEKPLLHPISLLVQPHHFGPPALFFSSRGGHSTAIVDGRGRSVLKGRFVWSSDEQEEPKSTFMGKMGDIKRIEALDVEDRAVLIALRQGGLEAVDLCDALLCPADASRTILPHFVPSVTTINRRAPFVWKIGTPISTSTSTSTPVTATATVPSSKGKNGSYGQLQTKRLSTGPIKSPSSRSEFPLGDAEVVFHDEMLFLGRKEDEIYFCERNAGSFKILRLSPSTS